MRIKNGRMRATGLTKTGRSGVSQDGTGAFPPPQQPPLFDNARESPHAGWGCQCLPGSCMLALPYTAD